jgi:predicted nucleic acid-binding protein
VRQPTLLDTGPLVAYLSWRDPYHEWAIEEFAATSAPFLTCEAVVVEASFLLGKFPDGIDRLFEAFALHGLRIAFRLDAELDPVAALMNRYRNVPMSLADACLVRMAETNPGSVLLTLDRDFRIYRMSRRKVIPLRMPSAK